MFSLILFNILVSTFFSFWTSWALVELSLFLLRAPHGRVRYYARLIPLFKLPLDLYLIDWSSWALMQGVEPWNCEPLSRAMNISFNIPQTWIDYFIPKFSISFSLYDTLAFFPADYLFHRLGNAFPYICTSLITMCLALSLLRSYKLTKAWLFIRRVTQDAEKRAPFFLIDGPFSPFVWRSRFFIPRKLYDSLTPEERNVTLAHEVRHIHYRDNMVKLLVNLIQILFPWIPSGRLFHLALLECEIACDRNLKRDPLLSALVKTARYCNKATIASAFMDAKMVKKRVNFIINPSKNHYFTLLILIYSLLGILTGKFWLL